MIAGRSEENMIQDATTLTAIDLMRDPVAADPAVRRDLVNLIPLSSTVNVRGAAGGTNTKAMTLHQARRCLTSSVGSSKIPPHTNSTSNSSSGRFCNNLQLESIPGKNRVYRNNLLSTPLQVPRETSDNLAPLNLQQEE